MLTQEDYIKLAEIIKRHPKLGGYESNKFINDLCDWLKENNPGFNEAKFRKASGLPSWRWR